MSQDTVDPFRLPTSIRPSHYDLTVAPDLEAVSFEGTVRIRLDVREPVSSVVLNALDLRLLHATFAGPDDTEAPVAGIWLDPEHERATFALGRTVAPGAYSLEVAFEGVLNDKLAGFYRSTFTEAGGHPRVIATTQLQSTDARRAFPCFDEPAFKATFAITLLVPDGLFAVSNAPLLSEESLPDGRRKVRFADTLPMSTYLVAFAVGPFEATEPVDVDGVPLRVVHVPGKGHLAAYALTVGAHALRFFSSYYGIPCPGGKLDLLAIPDFAFGAMENLGCVTFREVLLLIDEGRAAQPDLLRVADVVAHEIAHLWFGDLVTMRWWNGVWLNEAFATFMATLCTDDFRPDWGRWDQFARERSAAFDVDALAATRPIEYEVRSPSDADGMFDVLTYEKGASVLRMLEQYLGAPRFRDGVRHYLRRHACGNTETGDLWDAIEEVTGEPVRRIMDSWIFQPGFPLVSVSWAGGEGLDVRQERFFYDGSQDAGTTRWCVPLILRGAAGGRRVDARELLETDAGRIAVGGSPDWALVNAGTCGFYRVRYSAELLGRLAGHLADALEPVERYALLDDTWASLLAGATSAPEFLALTKRFSGETDLDVWTVLAGCLAELDRLLAGEARVRFQQLVAALCAPALERVGWEPRRGGGEPPRTLELRGLLIRCLAVTARDEAAAVRCQGLHTAYLQDTGSVEPNIAAAAAAAVASRGDAAEYDVFVRRFLLKETPQEERRYRSLLAAFPGRAEMARTLAQALDGTVRTQDAPYLVGLCLENRDHGTEAWAFVKEHWDRMLREYPDNAIVRMLAGVRALSTPEAAADVHRFFEAHRVPTGERTLAQHLERLRVNVALRGREAERLAQALLAEELYSSSPETRADRAAHERS
ncbi:MAG: M1 family metallopeptidase [Deltaproteobacteria bacterium]|nr:M1 family metallopeptidase [Deltaproteobacteria bacterium]